jgi:hypothetical protein
LPRGRSEPDRLHPAQASFVVLARSTWPAQAHARLDAAVLAAYGWPGDLTDEQLLERLLALNVERSRVDQGK